MCKRSHAQGEMAIFIMYKYMDCLILWSSFNSTGLGAFVTGILNATNKIKTWPHIELSARQCSEHLKQPTKH